MKRFLFIISLCLIHTICPLQILGLNSDTTIIEQDTRWNPKTNVYSDFKNGFSWSFPPLDWEISSGTERHTVFKVIESNTGLTVFVNVNPITTSKNPPNDIFQIYEKLASMEDVLESQVEKVTGAKIIENSRKKTKLAGKNAIKRRYITKMEDDRYEKPMQVLAITYSFIYNNSTWSISIKCHKEIYDYLISQNYNIEDIFKGFQFIHIN